MHFRSIGFLSIIIECTLKDNRLISYLCVSLYFSIHPIPWVGISDQLLYIPGECLMAMITRVHSGLCLQFLPAHCQYFHRYVATCTYLSSTQLCQKVFPMQVGIAECVDLKGPCPVLIGRVSQILCFKSDIRFTQYIIVKVIDTWL